MSYDSSQLCLFVFVLQPEKFRVKFNTQALAQASQHVIIMTRHSSVSFYNFVLQP